MVHRPCNSSCIIIKRFENKVFNMEFFLQECRPNLKNSSDFTRIQIVIGNEACDLDSAVSALVTAYFLHKMQIADLVVPVLNVERKDLPLRTEVTFFLEETSVPLDSLICIDDIDLKALSENENVGVILVDHNSLSVEQSYLEPRIVQIIDHHVIENPEKMSKYKTKIEPVGSCCTLVAEEIFLKNEDIMDPQLAMLLYGTILLDTICLQESAKRVTEKDIKMVEKLETYLDGLSREEVFGTLQRVKFDVSKLNPEQLLEKDVKFITWESTNVAIASLPILLQNIVESESFLSALHQFATEKKLKSVIMLGSKISDKSCVKRQIGIYDPIPDSLAKITTYLLSLENPSLELQPLPFSGKSVALFDQENISLTRKFVLPAMQSYLKSVATDDSKTKDADTNCENINTYLNGYKGRNSIGYAPDAVPLYQAETLDFPESPKHSKLLGITVQLQKLNADGENENEILDPDDIDLQEAPELTSVERGGTLKKIAVFPLVLNSEDVEEFDQRSMSSLSNRSDLDVFSPTDDIILPDDVDTLEELENSDYLESSVSDPIPEMSAAEEFEEERSWKSCLVNGEEINIDMKVIEPYRKVLSHGGYQGDAKNAIIIFSACYLPDRSRKDYDYVMDNLFLYVITTLDELVAEDYVLVYLHGATDRSNMPSFGWLKRCYQMIDRRLRKNLKGLYLVHPTFWLKTIVIMTRPFISSKFSRKLQFVYSLKELSDIIPLDHVSIPEKVKQLELERIMKDCLKLMKPKKANTGSAYSPSIKSLSSIFDVKL